MIRHPRFGVSSQSLLGPQRNARPVLFAVRCVAHVAALSVFSKNVAPGEKPKMEGVIEQRVTAFFVSLLIGADQLNCSRPQRISFLSRF